MNIRELRLAAAFAAKGDVRYYLNGVKVTPSTVTASTGHMLAHIKCEEVVDLPEPLESIIIPIESVNFFLNKVKKVGGVYSALIMRDSNVPGNYIIFQESSLMYESFTPIEAKYPDFSKVFIGIDSGVHVIKKIDFNFSYLYQIQKAINVFKGNKSTQLLGLELLNTETAGYIRCENATIIIMPMRA